jgi:hypothetical protein
MTRTISKIYNTTTADCIRYAIGTMEASATKAPRMAETIEFLRWSWLQVSFNERNDEFSDFLTEQNAGFYCLRVPDECM